MSRIITTLIVLFVGAGVIAVSVGEHWSGLALLIIGVCFLGVRRKFDWLSLLEEGGIPDTVSEHARSNESKSHGSDSLYDSDDDSGGGSHTDYMRSQVWKK